MKVEPRRVRPGETARRSPSKLIFFGLVYLGFSAGLEGYLDVELGLLSLHFVVAVALAWIGWHGLTSWPALRRYMRYAAALSICFCVSSIAAWDPNALFWSVVTSGWLLFVVPGIANLLRNVDYRKGLLLGIVGAALTYAFTALGRLVTGREIFDLPDPDRAVLLGVKRGIVNSRLLNVIPFLVAGAARIAPKLRWVGAAAAVAGIVVSGGRSGLIGLAVVGLTFTVLRPGASQKLRAVLVAALMGFVLVTAIGEFGGEAVVGKNRLLSYVRGERTNSDEVREAQLKRAWHYGLRNPVFGIGYRHLEGARDEAAFEGVRKIGTRQNAAEGGVHNTYAQLFAEFGVPGVAAFVLLLFSVLRTAMGHRHRPEIRAAITGFAAVLLMMMFHPIALAFIYYQLAFVVGALGDDEAPDAEGSVGRLSDLGAPSIRTGS
jgi:O-antigen ligase